MSKDFSNVAYAETNLKFDKDLFIKEYDELILPNAKPFIRVNEQWGQMKKYNQFWKVITNKEYVIFNNLIRLGKRLPYQWDMINLMHAEGDIISGGGAFWRHRNLDKPKTLKEPFKDSYIVKWIMANIPAQKIMSIHCVSMEPGTFVTIHRDAFWKGTDPNPAANNGYYKRGYVVINLNISNGGSPLLWSLDGEEQTPRSADADCYMISDYFLHAVPLVKERRRQIRIGFIPNPDLLDQAIKWNTAVKLPEDFQYTFGK